MSARIGATVRRTVKERKRTLVIGVLSTIVFFVADRWKDVAFVQGTSDLVDRLSNTVWVVSLAVTFVAFVRGLARNSTPEPALVPEPGPAGDDAPTPKPESAGDDAPATRRRSRLVAFLLLPAPLVYPATVVVVMVYAVLLTELAPARAVPEAKDVPPVATTGAAPVPTAGSQGSPPVPAASPAQSTPAQRIPATTPPAASRPVTTPPVTTPPVTTPPVVPPTTPAAPPDLLRPWRLDYQPQNFGSTGTTIVYYTAFTTVDTAQCAAAGLAAPAVPGAVGPCYSALWYSDPARQHLASGSPTYFRSERVGTSYDLRGAQPGSTDGNQVYTGTQTGSAPTTYHGTMRSDNTNHDYALYDLVAD